MRELNTCLKLNFFNRKIVALATVILFASIYFLIRKHAQYMCIENWFVLQEMILFIYAAYGYKPGFAHWISIGGKRKTFYLGSVLLFVLIAVVLSSVQLITFSYYISNNKLLLGNYGTLKVREIAGFTPLGIWTYQFIYFLFSLFAGNLLGALSVNFNKGIAFSIFYQQ